MVQRRTHKPSYNHRKCTRDAGYEAALRHIEDAEKLTAELGGTDQDVKAYFFSLPPHQLKEILDEYGLKYGENKRQYAEQTFNDWRAGRTKMSGTVAQRLFDLLPPRMPIEKKYELVENLWHHLGPKSNLVFTIGYDVLPETVVAVVAHHTLKEMRDFVFPADLERRFEWLASGDVIIKQKLLNHLRQLERSAILSGAEVQIPVIMQHLNSTDGRSTQSASQEIKIGNHTVLLEFERNHSGMTEGSIRSSNPAIRDSSEQGWSGGWLIVAAAILGLFFLFGR